MLAVEVPDGPVAVPEEPELLEDPDELPLHMPVPVLLDVPVVPVPVVVVAAVVVVVCATSCESRL
jgi:hypothetical protein